MKNSSDKSVPFVVKKLLIPQDVEVVNITDGCCLALLPTLQSLEEFVFMNGHIIPFAARSALDGNSPFNLGNLDIYYWLFGISKVAVVKEAYEFEKNNFVTKWFEILSDGLASALYQSMREDEAKKKNYGIQTGQWTEQEELNYRNTFCTGYWELSSPFKRDIGHVERLAYQLFDKELPQHLAEIVLCRDIFDNYVDAPIYFYDHHKMYEEIEYWKKERRVGNEYYGEENERINLRIPTANDS
jgi:hypothetical protein